jgi:uncharacterized damage-inducible protein DinB
MTHAENLLQDFDTEMANTRKVLERIPDDRLDWQPHPKSHTIGWNANHVTDIVNWITMTLTTPSVDIAPPGGQPYQAPTLTSREKIVAHFDQNCAVARKAIAQAKDEEMGITWTLSRGGNTLISMPRSAVARMCLNHLIHHRSHLCVYLRLNDIPVPGMYGPSGDE